MLQFNKFGFLEDMYVGSNWFEYVLCATFHFFFSHKVYMCFIMAFKTLFKVFPKHIFAAKLQFILTTTCNIPAMKLTKKKY